MGYPTEIANSMPRQQPVPLLDPRPSPLARLIRGLRRLCGRRKRTRADFPPSFGRGVDAGLPPLEPEAARRLDVDELAGRLLREPR